MTRARMHEGHGFVIGYGLFAVAILIGLNLPIEPVSELPWASSSWCSQR